VFLKAVLTRQKKCSCCTYENVTAKQPKMFKN